MINQSLNLNDILVWDIETIPNQSYMTPLLQKKLESKAEKLVESRNYDKEEAINLIASTNPFFGQVIVIGIYELSNRFPKGYSTVIKSSDEYVLLNSWWNLIKEFNGTFVGFNSLNFDAYFIHVRSMYHNITPTNKNFLNLRKFSSWPHYDIMQHLGNWGFENRPSLEQATEFFGIKSPKDGSVKASEVYKAYKGGRLDEIADYCKRDVLATYELFKRTSLYLPS